MVRILSFKSHSLLNVDRFNSWRSVAPTCVDKNLVDNNLPMHYVLSIFLPLIINLLLKYWLKKAVAQLLVNLVPLQKKNWKSTKAFNHYVQRQNS